MALISQPFPSSPPSIKDQEIFDSWLQNNLYPYLQADNFETYGFSPETRGKLNEDNIVINIAFTDLTAVGNVLLGDGDDTIVLNPAVEVSFSDKNIAHVGDISLDSISADDGSSFSILSNWTNTGNTIADLGSVSTVDINGGTLDNVTIGAAVPGAGTFLNLTVVGNVLLGDGDDTITFNPATSVSFSDKNITNVGNIALDSISSDGSTITIGLGNSNSIVLTDNTTTVINIGTDAGDDFSINNGGDILLIEGDTGLATLTGNLTLSKADPTLTWTDTGDNNSASIDRSDTNATWSFKNKVMILGAVGKALDFDGTDDFITLTNLSALNGINKASFSMWIKLDVSSGNNDIIGQRTSASNQWLMSFQGTSTPSNGVFFFLNTGSVNNWIKWNPNLVSDLAWHHLLFVYDGTQAADTDKAKLYVDGDLKTAIDDIGNIPTTFPDVTATTARIADLEGIASRHFNGLIDEIAIWTEELSANDASDLYNSGNGFHIDPSLTWPTDGGSMGANLVAVWHHDETGMNQAPGGLDTTDSSGNGHHGTAEASMTDGDFVTGKVTTPGDDTTVTVLESKESAASGIDGILTINTPDGESILQGNTIKFKAGGSQRGLWDNSGTLIIDNGVTTAQQAIFRAAPSASENITEWQKSDETVYSFVDNTGNFNLNTITKIYFRDTAIGIYSQADTFLDLFADGAVRIGNSSGGAPTNYTKFEADGTLEFNGTATVWKDINIGAATLSGPPGLQPGIVNYIDEAAGDTGIATYGIAVGEGFSGQFEIQHDYKEGSDIYFHVHWQGIAAPTGTDKVQWQLTYTVTKSEATLDAVTVITVEEDFDAQYEFKNTAFAAITGTNFNIEDQFIFTLQRIAASVDEYGGEALTATVGIHYEQDMVGSRQILTK